MSDTQSLIRTLSDAITQRTAEKAALDSEINRLEEALAVLKQEPSDRTVTPASPVPGERVGSVWVLGDSGHPRYRYLVTAWRVDGIDGFVFTCGCPAFRFTAGDQWQGERRWCKHINRVDRYALVREGQVPR